MENSAPRAAQQENRLTLLKVLSPIHIWALGVGIVLVGEFMGWNFTVEKGGMYGSLIAAWVIGILYTSLVMINSEITSTIPAAGGQYAQAKHTIGPLMAFNVGLYLTLAYTMLEAANANVLSYLLTELSTLLGSTEGLSAYPFATLAIMVLAWLNYRGVFASLSVNFIITAFAFITIIALFIGVQGWSPGTNLFHAGLTGKVENGLPYGWIGAIAALQFGMWYYLGIEGTSQAAEECRSASRSIPLGSMAGIITLVIAATLTWFVATGLLPWQYLGTAITPLFDAAVVTGNGVLIILLLLGTLAATLASANGCINDAARAWFSMGRDRYLPAWFGAVHPRYRTPFRAIVFLVPVAIAFAILPVLLNDDTLLSTVITFSILSGLLGYMFMVPNFFRFRRLWPIGSIRRGYIVPFHPLPAIALGMLSILVLFATFLGYGTSLLSILVFYFLASIWFVIRRYKYVKRGAQFTASLPRPKGYENGDAQ
ncbi:amino acid permease-associated region [Rubrobacter xylanophilus DSM 9941]|uniref:Amino acid permease-associated region n=1 Tax=Rubrobacter xylanophilus (strain DSM 9941 / JCM 11954 / NBRC 16129 / PRD-1) TaxID=266117 RepID=Q1AT36_RUBXD|nr:amino acid permease [Rubrobacter xylanophilus]ABG05442.1 amino acid permease-associated region [Rubrobacter xylanophilus DSM 9941]